jgi:hypothetical protein
MGLQTPKPQLAPSGLDLASLSIRNYMVRFRVKKGETHAHHQKSFEKYQMDSWAYRLRHYLTPPIEKVVSVDSMKESTAITSPCLSNMVRFWQRQRHKYRYRSADLTYVLLDLTILHRLRNPGA